MKTKTYAVAALATLFTTFGLDAAAQTQKAKPKTPARKLQAHASDIQPRAIADTTIARLRDEALGLTLKNLHNEQAETTLKQDLARHYDTDRTQGRAKKQDFITGADTLKTVIEADGRLMYLGAFDTKTKTLNRSGFQYNDTNPQLIQNIATTQTVQLNDSTTVTKRAEHELSPAYYALDLGQPTPSYRVKNEQTDIAVHGQTVATAQRSYDDRGNHFDKVNVKEQPADSNVVRESVLNYQGVETVTTFKGKPPAGRAMIESQGGTLQSHYDAFVELARKATGAAYGELEPFIAPQKNRFMQQLKK